ncbi:MAG: amidohydrolase family protein [Pseudobutyrivibrio sp.]|nr:amidohydrolase family protein [Pseudobutyrivibrio sp.]
MQVFHGKIITCDKKNNVANYLVEKEGRIAYIGDRLPAQFEMIPPIELGGRVVVPAFVDTHMHYSAFSVLHKLYPIEEVSSNATILARLREYVESTKDPIIVGFGASEFAVSEGHLILKEQLDEVCQDRPVCIIKRDAHSAVINSVFVDMIRSKASTLRGYNDITGEMSQEAFMVVAEYVFNGLSTRRVIDSMVSTADFLASRGVGLFNSASGIGFIRDYDFDMERSVARGLDNGMKMEVSYQTTDLSKASKKDMKRVVFANLDGTFANRDAALNESYSTINNKGISYYADQEVEDFCRKANRAGYQIALHAKGDAAFDQATMAIAQALEDYPRFDHRHIIFHGSLPSKRGLEICAAYDIMLAVNPTILTYPDNVYDFMVKNLSKPRVERMNPLREARDMGVRICFQSGAPASDPDPIRWISDAVNNVNPDQSVSVHEALRMATYYGALSCFEEKESGTLEIGKCCDIVILDRDITEIPLDEIKDVTVSEMYLRGKIYSRSRAGAMTTMLRGMFPQ